MTNTNETVVKNVSVFVNLVAGFVSLHRKLGIPLETKYKVEEIDGSKVLSRYEEVITPQYLLENYDYTDIVSASGGMSPSTYLHLKTSYSKERYNTETFSYRLAPELLAQVKKQGFEHNIFENFKTVGYAHNVGGRWFFPFFEGYPRTSLLPKDFVYSKLTELLTKYFGDGAVEVVLAKTDNNGISTLHFENVGKLLSFLAQDGAKVLISPDGRVMFKFYVTLHGDSRSYYQTSEGVSVDISGTFVTSINLF